MTKPDTKELADWKIMMCRSITCIECEQLSEGVSRLDGAFCPGRYAVI